ncbi:MAG: hypothetical protein ACE1ZQ_05980 [Ignavibacteriaceae bacterium]
MKHLQKLILPLLVISIIALVYFVYFSAEGLGSFSDFDINNSASKDIKVEILHERGINNNAFFVIDKTGKEVLVHADHLPSGIESAKVVVLRGHLNKDSFHAHNVLLD